MNTLLLLGALTMSDPALADGRHVRLVDDGPTLMDDKREYKNLITPGMMLVSPGVKLRYQRQLTDHVSVLVGGGINAGAIQNCDCDGLSWARWQVLGGVDIHPMGNGMHGVYFGPRVLYREGATRVALFNQEARTAQDLAVYRGIIGYRAIIDPGLSIAVGVGGSYRRSLRTYGVNDNEDSALFSRMIVPSAEVNLSWAF